MGFIKKGKAFTELEKSISDLHANGVTEINLLDLKDMMLKISYEQYSTRFDGVEVAEELSDFVNSMQHDQRDDFVATVTSDHRTLQQNTFSLMLNCITQWGVAYKNGNYDARNERAVKASDMMMKVFE